MKIFYFLFVILLSSSAYSANEVSAISKVNTILSVSEYGQGDVIFKMDENGTQCTHGYWLRPSDPGFESNLSVVLSAFHSQSNLRVIGQDHAIWTGSSAYTYCHVSNISLRR